MSTIKCLKTKVTLFWIWFYIGEFCSYKFIFLFLRQSWRWRIFIQRVGTRCWWQPIVMPGRANAQLNFLRLRTRGVSDTLSFDAVVKSKWKCRIHSAKTLFCCAQMPFKYWFKFISVYAHRMISALRKSWWIFKHLDFQARSNLCLWFTRTRHISMKNFT